MLLVIVSPTVSGSRTLACAAPEQTGASVRLRPQGRLRGEVPAMGGSSSAQAPVGTENPVHAGQPTSDLGPAPAGHGTLAADVA